MRVFRCARYVVATGRIYLITNLVNGKRYVGQTTASVPKRWRQHQAAARAGSTTALHRAIRQHGAENFGVSELELATDLDAAEVSWIRVLRCEGPLYNQTSGGQEHHILDGESRRRLSKSQKARLQNPVIRQRMSEAAKRQWSDPEFRARAALRTRAQFEQPFRRLQSSVRVAAWHAANPDHRTTLSEYNKTAAARRAKSVSRKRYFLEHPETRRKFSEAQCRYKADYILGELAAGEKIASDLECATYSRKSISEGLSRYAKVGLVTARPLKDGERSDVVGRGRSKTKVWRLCA